MQLTTGSGLALEEIGNYVATPGPGGNLVWTADYLVDNPASVLTFGTTGLTVKAGAGLLQDSTGNSTAAFSSFPVANDSLVDADGFTTGSFARGTGGATVYVSSSHGKDTNSFAQAQNPATPYQTLTQALGAVYANGMNGKGAAIKLLDGDTFTSGGAIKVGGQDAAHPFIIENYWYQYTTGAVDPQTRPVVAIDESSPTAPSSVLSTFNGGGTPNPLSNVVVRNLNFQAVNWTGNYAAGRTGMDFVRRATTGRSTTTWCRTSAPTSTSRGSTARSATSPSCGAKSSTPGRRLGGAVALAGPLHGPDHGALISQCVFDDNGRISADRTGRDIFSHNAYIQYTCGPTLVWGNTFTNGGSHGLQAPGGRRRRLQLLRRQRHTP